MLSTAIASLVLYGASAAATAVGSAHVVNNCDYDVYLCNVPASGGGYDQQDKTLAAGESWEQTWTQLSNGDGWSIKLSKSSSLNNILQYEYTFHNDGIIWYDLSCVNGNPWDQDWEITASGTDCNPKQQAYRYATDDAYGMQACSQNALITVSLCTGLSADNGTSTGGSSSAPSYSSSLAAAPAYSSSSASAPSYGSSSTQSPDTYSTSTAEAPPSYATSYGINWNNNDASASAQTTPTTLETQTTATITHGPNVVTDVETAYVTNIVTAYAANRFRRHEHHAHGHQEHHA